MEKKVEESFLEKVMSAHILIYALCFAGFIINSRYVYLSTIVVLAVMDFFYYLTKKKAVKGVKD